MTHDPAGRPPRLRERSPAEFLHALLGGHPAAPAVDCVAATRAWSPREWERLLGLAMLENAVPLLRSELAAHPDLAVPPIVRARIDGLAFAWTLRLAQLERRLGESLRILAGAGIEVMLLKGAALAATVYRGFVDRPMADVDLLVDPAHAAEAQALLCAAGWAPVEMGAPATAWDHHHHLRPLEDRRGSGLRLELHVDVVEGVHPFGLDADLMRRDVRAVDVGGVRVAVPEPHVHALHVAVHFAWSHRCESGGLNAMRDIARLHARGLLDWERLVALARETGAERCCYWLLRLARRTVGLPVAESVLASLAPDAAPRRLRVLEHHLHRLMLRERGACPSVLLRRRLWAAALGVQGESRGTASVWQELASAQSAPAQGASAGAWDKLSRHVRRVPHWSQYAAGMLNSALQAGA